METTTKTTEPIKVIDYDSDDDDNRPPPPPENESDSDDDVSDSDNDNRPPPPQESDDDMDDDMDDDDNRDDDDDIDPETSLLNRYENENVSNTNDQLIQPDDFDSDADEDDDENYLQKFDESLSQQIIADYHPEMKAHNYDEIIKLSKVTRNADGIIIDPLHNSLPFITRYEKAKIIGERSTQLAGGATPFVQVEDTVIDEYLIATKEFNEKKIPFIIKRPMPNGGCEYWRFEDLEILI
jgi:DNA-directed RNA polymerase I, II, and III subunit RPABC2